MRYMIGIMVIIVAMLIAGCLPAFMDSITDFRTDLITDEYLLTTNTTTINGTVQLSSDLWEGKLNNVSLSSNITADTPVLSSYTAGSKALAFTGLSANTTRVITAVYKTAGLANYTGAETGAKVWPVILIIALIAIVLFVIVYAIVGGR